MTIISRPATQRYRTNWDDIFGPQQPQEQPQEDETEHEQEPTEVNDANQDD